MDVLFSWTSKSKFSIGATIYLSNSIFFNKICIFLHGLNYKSNDLTYIQKLFDPFPSLAVGENHWKIWSATTVSNLQNFSNHFKLLWLHNTIFVSKTFCNHLNKQQIWTKESPLNSFSFLTVEQSYVHSVTLLTPFLHGGTSVRKNTPFQRVTRGLRKMQENRLKIIISFSIYKVSRS